MKKKKVGIITFHNEQNYGAVLQAYALQETIKKLGCESYIINYIEPIEKYWKSIFTEKQKIANIKIWLKIMITNIVYFKKNRKRKKNFYKFINKNIKLYGKYKNERQLKDNAPEFDVYITGSDQVWNTKITKGLKDAYTLNFGTSNITRASYAASLGNDKIDESEIAEYREKLKILNKISVREDTGKEILEKILHRNIELVLDPTLLLDRKDWNNVKSDSKDEKKKYILIYDLEKNNIVYEVANEIKEKLKIPIVNFRRKRWKKIIGKYESGPEEFLNLINNAEIVVTNSFHGAVFSIIFHKKFYVIPHTTTFSRTKNLLRILNLEKQIIGDKKQIKDILSEEEINYELVEEKLKIERQKSIKYIEKVLNY